MDKRFHEISGLEGKSFDPEISLQMDVGLLIESNRGKSFYELMKRCLQ